MRVYNTLSGQLEDFQPQEEKPVSYTHLDVYKRQGCRHCGTLL